MRKIIYSFLLLLTFCQDRQNDNVEEKETDFEDNYTLVSYDTKSFALDSLTAAKSNCIQLYKKGKDNTYLCLLNQHTNSIYFFDYISSKYAFKIDMQKEGPSGVGSIDSFFIHDFDSIFIHSYYGRKIHHLNKDGKVIRSYNLINDKFPDSLMPSSTISPILLKDKQLYISGSGQTNRFAAQKSDESLKNIVMVLDLKTGNISASFFYPELYKKGIWLIEFHDYYCTLSAKSGNFIYSFSADPFIYETNHQDLLNKYEAGSTYLKAADIEPISLNQPSSPFVREARAKYYFTHASYKGIFQDAFTGFYFRVVLYPISEHDYNSNHPTKSRTHKFGIIILDKNFKKVGEVKMPDYIYYPDMIFITEAGLHIAKMDEKNEDVLKFDVFKLKKK